MLHYFLLAVIVVVDSGDYDRIFEARDAIHGVLICDNLSANRILILANKQVSRIKSKVKVCFKIIINDLLKHTFASYTLWCFRRLCA